jgi:MYXO-CTERM domain-containing protein
MKRFAVVLATLALAAVPAFAAPAENSSTVTPLHGGQLVEYSDADGVVRHADVVLPPEAFTASAGDPISPIIFMNRCKGGCTMKSSARDDARTNQTTIPSVPDGTDVPIPEFPWGDAVWGQFMTCIKDVYSPYNVMVTDVDPGTNVVHHEVIVAGTSADVGLSSNILGIAPVAGDCLPKNNNISYAFAGSYPPSEVLELCATAAQESAHSWGLDHEFDCTDPMTYLSGCGEKFFRNKAVQCGEFSARTCNCGGVAQNSHLQILSVFGPGTSTVPAPTIDIISPKNNDVVTNGFSVFANATGLRGVARLEVWVNGYKWATFTPTDIHAGGPFTIAMPTNLPDGVMDLEARAYDDLELYNSTTITVTKGAPCTVATTCATGQACDAGKCHWNAPDKELGDACTFPQECKTAVCQDVGGASVCTQGCFTGIAGQCPTNFECVSAGTASGFCLEGGGGGGGTGCCSAGDDSASEVAMHLGLIGLVGAIVFRRRRRS